MAPRLAVRLFATAILMTATVAGPLSGQDQPPGRRGSTPEQRAQLEERIRTRMSRMMEERLELTEDEARSVSEVVGRFDRRRRDLMRRVSGVRRQVEALTEADRGDEEAAAGLLASLIELRQTESRLFVEEQAALREVLSSMKVLQLQSLREQLGRRIRRLQGGENGGRGRRGGGGPSGENEGEHSNRRHGRSGNVAGVYGVPLSL
ncbi:MAG: hypothetical protein ACKVIN_11580 [Longimicrobiales bacterium]